MDAAPHGSWPLHVVVVGFNRPHSLARLVRSLASAEYAEGASISVRFALDFAANASVDAAIDDVVHSLAWPHGAVSIRRRRQHAGLRDNILGAWQPRAHAAPALFLEDDLEVSSLWWRWVQACLGRYASPPPPELIGISLFTPDDMFVACCTDRIAVCCDGWERACDARAAARPHVHGAGRACLSRQHISRPARAAPIRPPSCRAVGTSPS
jgi:hypothetical protein